MAWLTQCAVVSMMFLRTIPQRLGASITATVGVAGVVVVMVGVLSILEGFKVTLQGTGSPDNALVLRSGSDSELSSGLTLDQTRIIADAPGIRRSDAGPLTSSELYVVVDLPKRSTGTDANVPLRGVQQAAFDVRGQLRIVEGRRFESGRNEIIAGVGAARAFGGLELGGRLRFGESEWIVVGLFEAEGSLSESELWCDVNVLQPAYRRVDFQSVHVKLDSAGAFEEFKDALTTDPRLQVRIERETDYYAGQSDILEALIRSLGQPLVLLMFVGALFGTIITMYSAVAARTREIATLRALGFGGGPAVVAVLCESLLLALAGGLIGAAGAYFAFNGYQAATLNWSTFSQVVFSFRVTPRLMLSAIGVSLAMGLLGGLFPAIRAARTSVAVALRDL